MFAVLGLAVLFLASSPTQVVAQTRPPVCSLDDGFYDRFARELGWIQLNRQRRFHQLLECFVQLDTANNVHTTNVEFAEFAPRMYMALLKVDPADFISVMARNLATFQHLLDELDQAFVWEEDPPNPLEDELHRIVLLVEATDVGRPDESAIKARLLQRLSRVVPRVID